VIGIMSMIAIAIISMTSAADRRRPPPDQPPSPPPRQPPPPPGQLPPQGQLRVTAVQPGGFCYKPRDISNMGLFH
jgi:hypothetical protein